MRTRLAAKLTGWRIDIRSDVSVAEAKAAAEARSSAAEPKAEAGVAAAEQTGDREATAAHDPARMETAGPQPKSRRAPARARAATRPAPTAPADDRAGTAEEPVSADKAPPKRAKKAAPTEGVAK